MNTPNKGAVAFLGATNDAMISSNIELNENLFEILMTHQNLSLGASIFLANIIGQLQPNYNLLGDPALSLSNKSQHNLPDLITHDSHINVLWSPYDGEPEVVEVKIFNNGTQSADNIKVQCFDGDPEKGGQKIATDQHIDFLLSLGGNQTIQFLTPDKVDGRLTVYLKIDPDNTINELDEENNSAGNMFCEPRFIDVAPYVGIADTIKGGFAAMGDYNNDDYIDLFVTCDGPGILYRNKNDGTFNKIKITSDNINSLPFHRPTFVDYNSDGYLDIFLHKKDGNIFYRNNQDETFSQIDIVNENNTIINDNVLGFLDFDNDGLLDMVTNTRADKTIYVEVVLYRNLDNAVFEKVNTICGLDSLAGVTNAAFGDYDNDGDLDIYLVIIGVPNMNNHLCQNIGDGNFVDVTHDAGVGCISRDDGAWAGFGDYDYDGYLDLFVKLQGWINKNVLYKNNRDGTFYDVTAITNLDSIHGGRLGSFIDYNNDSYLDLFTNVAAPGIYQNNKDGTFVIDTTAFYQDEFLIIDAIGDYDNDGDLDLFETSGYQQLSNCLYRNKGNNNNWLEVKLKGKESNSFGIGSRIELVTGSIKQIRDVLCIVGDPHNSVPTEFGSGNHSIIDTLKVIWPSGSVDQLTSVAANRILTIEEGYGDTSIPHTHELFQNYPNPFNNNTTIRYSVGGNPSGSQEMKNVEISIYNILGQMIVTLIERKHEPGKYSVLWDGRDSKGLELSSGLYFFYMITGDVVSVRKGLLLK